MREASLPIASDDAKYRHMNTGDEWNIPSSSI